LVSYVESKANLRLNNIIKT